MSLVRIYSGFSAVFVAMTVVFSWVNFHIRPVPLFWTWMWLLSIIAIGNFAMAIVYVYRKPPHKDQP